jgi:hypothetical protein
MPVQRTRPSMQRAEARRSRLAGRRTASPHSLIRLASRLLLAQAGACAALGVGFSRRNLPWLLLAVLIAAAVAGLAVLVRSGSHAAWQIAVTAESGLVAIGLFRFAYAGYLGGTLLGTVTLGTLLHPAVSRAFVPMRDGIEAAVDRAGLPDGAGELQGSPAGS